MATIDRAAPTSARLSVAERQGTATAQARQFSLPYTRIVQGIWLMWLVAMLLVLLPYFPNIFGGTAFLFSVLPGLFGIFAGLLFSLPTFVTSKAVWLLSFLPQTINIIAYAIHYLPTVVVDSILRPWFGLTAGTRDMLLTPWFSLVFVVLGAAAIYGLWRAISVLPAVFGVLVGMVTAIVGVLTALATLQIIGYLVDLIYQVASWLTSSGAALEAPLLILAILAGLLLVPYLWRQARLHPEMTLAPRIGLRVLAVAVAVLVATAVLLLMSLLFQGLDSIFSSVLTLDVWAQIALLLLMALVGGAILRLLWIFVPRALHDIPEGSVYSGFRSGVIWVLRLISLVIGIGVVLMGFIVLSYPLNWINDFFTSQPGWLANLNEPVWVTLGFVLAVASLVLLLKAWLGTWVEAIGIVNIALAAFAAATLLFNNYDAYGANWFTQVWLTLLLALLAGALYFTWERQAPRFAPGASAPHLAMSIVAGVIALIIGALALIMGAPFTSRLQWFDDPGWVFTLFFSAAGVLLLTNVWQWIGYLPVAFHGIARFVAGVLAAVVVMEFLVLLSYPLKALWQISATLLVRIDPSVRSLLVEWWFVGIVLVIGGLLIPLMWGPLRSLAVGTILASLILWAHAFGWVASHVQPQALVEKAPYMGEIMGQLAQPDIFGRDQQVLTVQMQNLVGVDNPPSNILPVTAEGHITSTLQTKRAIPAGEEIVAPKDETEAFDYKVTLSSGQVAPGQTIVVKASGLRPNTPGVIRWQSTGLSASLQDLGTFTPDVQGYFEGPVTVPEDPERVISLTGTPNTIAFTQTWDSGEVYLTDTFALVRDAIVETIFLALIGTTLGVIVSIPLSFLASSNLMSYNFVSKGVYVVTRTFLNVLRSVEVLIWAVIFVAAVGLGPFAGMLALAIHAIASLGKLYSEAIEAIDPGPIEAITATGANRLQVIRYAVIPQFIPQFVSFTLYRWDINVRMATIIGLVGGGGVGLLLTQYINLLKWHEAGTTILFIALIVIAMDYASTKIRAAVV